MSEPLTHNSSRVLEFDALRELLRGYASSPLGQDRIAALAPSTDSAWIDRATSTDREIREFRRVGGHFDFSGLLDITKLVKKSRIAGAVLETTEIRDVLLVVDRAAEWREIALHPPANMKAEWRRMPELSQSVTDFTEFLRFFRNKIQPDGTLEDRASPELARIRREIEKQSRLIQESLRGYLRRLAEGGTVQDELITIRGERFVIPVKIEQKRRVQGVVHGASSSGQTVFVEPLETIEQNNELVRLLDEELGEIHRILLEMTRRIGEHSRAILASTEVLRRIGTAIRQSPLRRRLQLRSRAVERLSSKPKTQWGRRLGCPGKRSEPPPAQCPPSVARKKSKTLKVPRSPNHRRTGRHPPPTGNYRPQHWRQNRNPKNGGTAGPNGAVRNSGSRRSRRAPSIRRSSSRHRRLSIDRAKSLHILRTRHQHRFHFTHGDCQSLVLLDELGSATDPEEGAALAVAIAEKFRQHRLHDRNFNPSHFVESLRRKYSGSNERVGGLRRSHAAAHI